MNEYDPRTLFFTTIMYIILLAITKTYLGVLFILPFLLGHILIFSIKLENLRKVLNIQ